MLPVLGKAASGSALIGEVVGRLAGQFALTDEKRRELSPSGRQTISSTGSGQSWSKGNCR